MQNLLIRTTENDYDAVCGFLREKLNFTIIDLVEITDKQKIIKSKKDDLRIGWKSIWKIICNLRKWKRSKRIVSIGNYSTLFLLVLNKLHIIQPYRLYWWGFFIHSKKVQRMLGYILHFLWAENVRLILFSRCESEMYRQRLGLTERMFISVPYGDWGGAKRGGDNLVDSQAVLEEGRYYFSGGYSNRDYSMLLRVWNEEMSDKKLIIIGSENNKELVHAKEENQNNQVEIMLDVTSKIFDQYLTGARACILPFKQNTGASGQSVTLRCMRLKKLIISTDTDIMREYIDDKKSGFLLKNFEEQLQDTIQFIEEHPIEMEKMVEAQSNIFYSRFSYGVITQRLEEVLTKEE